MPKPEENAQIIRRRLKLFYEQWRNGETVCGVSWEGVDAVAIDIGDTLISDSLSSHKTAFQVWLLLTEYPDSIMVFTPTCFYALVSERNYHQFQILRKHLITPASQPNVSYTGPKIELLYKDKTDGGTARDFEKLISSILDKDIESGQKLKLGLVRPAKKDKGATKFLKSWYAALDAKNDRFDKIDIADTLASIMAVKDKTELSLLKKANIITNNIFTKFLRDEIMTIVDGDLKVKHSCLADNLEKRYVDSKYIDEQEMKYVDACYPPIIQSGGKYSLKFNHTSTDEFIHFGVITCSFGSLYKGYCSNATRTLLINPSTEIKENYKFLQKIETEVMRLLTPGSRFSEIHSATRDFVRTRKPHLLDHLSHSLGFSIGILFQKQPLVITAESSIKVVKGMAIHVSVALTNLINTTVPLKHIKERQYALLLGDTIVVQEDGPAVFLAELLQKLSWVSFMIEPEEAEGSSENRKKSGLLVETEEELLGRGFRKAVLESRFRNDNGVNEKRRQLQKELMQKLNERAQLRHLSIKSSVGERNAYQSTKEFVSYKRPSKFPKDIEYLKIYVDSACDTVILPIFGLSVPFHVATLRNVSTSIEGDYIYLRVNFLNPSTTLILEKKTTPIVFRSQHFQFVKEMTFRSSTIKESGMKSAPGDALLTKFRLLKEMHKKYKGKVAEYYEMKNVSQQEALVCFDRSRKVIPTLTNIIIRPTVTSGERLRKKNSSTQCGMLEAHINGFRFRIRKETIDIMYSNIRYAIFQPCDFELGAFIHFVLNKEVLISKKRHFHVQFYCEAGEIVTDLGKRQNVIDRDENEENFEDERKLKVNLNRRFRVFCDTVESISNNTVEFEEPIRELAFTGQPGPGQNRSSVLLQPTPSCLVNVVDWPPFAIPLDEIELIHFERVEFVLKTFDMVIIFKDYTRKVIYINGVPTNRIEKIKSWLDISEIHYTEGPASLNWSRILKTINADPEAFFETGGWTFLEEEDDEESPGSEKAEGDEDGDSVVSDEEYIPPGEDEDDDDGDSDCSFQSSDSDSDVSDFDLSHESGSDESSEGKSWDELEREAKAADSQQMSSFGGGVLNRNSHCKITPSDSMKRKSTSILDSQWSEGKIPKRSDPGPLHAGKSMKRPTSSGQQSSKSSTSCPPLKIRKI